MHSALGLLSELGEEQIDWIFRTGSERTVIADTILVQEDEPISSIYIVLEGLFAVNVSSISGSDVGRLGPGEIIGEMSFLENGHPVASVIAIERSLLLEIPRDALKEKLRVDAVFAASFYRGLAILSSRRVRERAFYVFEKFRSQPEVR